jgi:uncharacterized protein YjbI with pentapeptide repeats
MFFSSLLFVLAASAVCAVVWATIISLLWLVIAAISQRLSRYWLVVLGTLRGAFLLGCGLGIISSFGASDDFGIPVSASIAGSFLGALGGALWGYYGLTGWLKAWMAGDHRSAREHFAAIIRPATPRRSPEQLPPVFTAPQQPLIVAGSSDEDTAQSPLTPLEKARLGDPAAIAQLLSRQLQRHCIYVQVQQHRGVLKIGLRRAAPLQPEPTIRFLQQGLEKLQPQGIGEVQVVGQSGGEAAQVWRRTFTLTAPSIPDVADPPVAVDLPPQPAAYQPPRDPRKLVLEIGRARYEIPAIVVWAIAGVLFLADLIVGSFVWLGLRFVLAALPALVAQSRGRPGWPWFLYGYIYVPLALIFAFILPRQQLPSLAQRQLQQSSFKGRSLQQVDFRSADLRGADFSRADLAGANFGNANCTGANFSGASISGTRFDKATLDQANFTQVRQGKAVVSLAVVFGTIPPVLWGLTLFVLTIAVMAMTVSWLFSWFPILPRVSFYSLGTGLVAVGLVALTHRNREAAPLVLGVSAAIASWAGLSNLALLRGGFWLVVIALGLALAAYFSLQRNAWAGYGAALGTLAGLGFIEVWIVVASGFTPAPLLKLLIWGIGAIAGCLSGAWIQATLTSFRAASLNGTDFTQGNLSNADFREANTTRARFKQTQRRGALFSDFPQQSTNRFSQKPS